ncbi:e9imm peptide [Kitasatospora sp. NPDC004531]
MDREAAVSTVQRIMDGEYADDAEVDRALVALARGLGCPGGYVSNLIFWPEGGSPTAAEIVEKALAYRPFAL